MITLFSGLPGNGKTLFALWYIKSKAEKEGRKVFYYNVKDLALDWTLFDPLKWMDLPHGSMILIDECQEIFPKKPNGSKLPDYYEELAKHRHKGFDIFLITQHPTLLDNFVRKLVGQHFHSVRKFGLERATIYEWSAAVDSPEKPSSRKSAVTLKFKFPKDVYTWYKSAEVHTVKKAIPFKIILAVLFIVAVPLFGYYRLVQYQNRGKEAKEQSTHLSSVTGGSAQSFSGTSSGVPGKPTFDPVADAKAYVQASTPRVVGLPQTAPRYDELTKPVRVPVPAACLQVGTVHSKLITCKCYSQQGTPMPVEFNMCIDIARNGVFQDFDAEKVAVQEPGRGERRVSSVGDSVQARQEPIQARDVRGGQVLTMADVPDPPRPPSVARTWGH